jgi:hypothetical protein
MTPSDFTRRVAAYRQGDRPDDVIRMLREELKRSQEHVYELYERIAHYAKTYEDKENQ